jgi:hypothetical protein
MLAQVGEPQRFGIDDEQSEDPVSFGQMADELVRGVVDANRDELRQAVPVSSSTPVRHSGHRPARPLLYDPAEHAGRIEIRAEGEHRVEEGAQAAGPATSDMLQDYEGPWCPSLRRTEKWSGDGPVGPRRTVAAPRWFCPPPGVRSAVPVRQRANVAVMVPDCVRSGRSLVADLQLVGAWAVAATSSIGEGVSAISVSASLVKNPW